MPNTHSRLSPAKRAFLSRAQQTADARLTDPDFTVEAFSRLMGLSRSQLFRKVKEATGASVSAFIRSRRLKQALRLMDEGVSPLVKMARECGFGNDTYFRACFKQEYGVPPSEYWKGN
ncbi:helix-turn-helix transcriptional regulator [bacterium]|nr:helix-turn-helix transcriptional regulator [bacterium]